MHRNLRDVLRAALLGVVATGAFMFNVLLIPTPALVLQRQVTGVASGMELFRRV